MITCRYEYGEGRVIEYTDAQARQTAYQMGLNTVSQTINTLRDYKLIARYLGITEQEFLDLMKGDVLDMGSGYGGLAISLAAIGLMGNLDSGGNDLRVWSANPNYAKKEFPESPKELKRMVRSELIGKLPLEIIAQGLQAHDLYSIPVLSYDLSVFPDGFFNTIVDNLAVYHHCPLTQKQFRRSIFEYLRVLKSGGLAIMGPLISFRGYDKRKIATVCEVATEVGAEVLVFRDAKEPINSSLVMQKY